MDIIKISTVTLSHPGWMYQPTYRICDIHCLTKEQADALAKDLQEVLDKHNHYPKININSRERQIDLGEEEIIRILNGNQ